MGMPLFYNSYDGDREYDAESMTEWLRPFFTTGIFNGGMQVKANGNMSVTVGAGYCNIGGKTKHFEEETTLDIEIASGTLNRIDNVVLRRDDTNRDIYLMIQKGGNAKTPSAPEIVRDGAIYDLKLAEVFITAGTIRITQANITDCRMLSAVCGWVVATVNEIDFTQIQAQFDSYIGQFKEEQVEEFVGWFNAIKSQFTDDAVGSLQIQINETKQNIDNLTPGDIGALPKNGTADLALQLKSKYSGFDVNIGDNTMFYCAAIGNSEPGLFPRSNNANAVLDLSRHPGKFYSQLGFSSNGNLYYRYTDGADFTASTPWKEIAFTTSNVASATKVNGHTVESNVPSNAKFTDTKVQSKVFFDGNMDISSEHGTTLNVPNASQYDQIVVKTSQGSIIIGKDFDGQEKFVFRYTAILQYITLTTGLAYVSNDILIISSVYNYKIESGIVTRSNASNMSLLKVTAYKFNAEVV